MAHAEDLTPKEPPRTPRAPQRPLRDEAPKAERPAPRRSRANEIAARLGLTPITGLSGPDILY